MLQLGQSPINQIVIALVVVAEQAAIAAGFALLIAIDQVGLIRRWLLCRRSLVVFPAPVAELQSRDAHPPHGCWILNHSAEHAGSPFG